MSDLKSTITREQPHYATALDAVKLCVGAPLFQSLAGEFAHQSKKFQNAKVEAFLAALAVDVRTASDFAQWTQQIIGNPQVRASVASFIAGAFPTVEGLEEQFYDYADTLEQDGLLRFPSVLDPGERHEMTQHLAQQGNLTLEGTLEKHPIADVVAAPHVLNLATHPTLLSIAGAHLGCQPTIVNIEAWWSPATGSSENGPEILHRDKDDFRACKFFMYLSDVGPEDGPHHYALRSFDPDFVASLLPDGTDKAKKVQDIFNMQYGGKNLADENGKVFASHIVEIHGPAGTNFFTNSFGLHRGKPVMRGRRGMIAVTYGMIGYSNRLRRFSESGLKEFPTNCSDTEMVRHALRLLWHN